MITLQRLHVNNFKGLREVDLLFPGQGSVLIEGYNEAGKSTLFEAVYVALYGKPLVGEDERARQEEVIQHGQPKATVELTVSVGPQLLTITRIFERWRSQYASLMIQQPGLEAEVVSRVRAVDERILKELGNLDGESLRNSCFVEQKELGRIEALRRSEREQAVQKLLGLERLTRLIEEFRPRREQDRAIAQAEKYLALAQVQEKIGLISTQEATLAERLDAVKIAAHLKRLTDIATQKDALANRQRELASSIQQAQELLDHCGAIKDQKVSCNQTMQGLTDVSHVRRELKHTQENLARLEHIEQVDLPEAEAYLGEVAKAAEAVRQVAKARISVQEAEESEREAQRLLTQLQQAEADQLQKVEDASRAQERVEQRRRDAEMEQQRLGQQLNRLEARAGRLDQALKLVKQWETACQHLYALQQEIAATTSRQQKLFELQGELRQRENEVREREEAANQAAQELENTAEAARFATASDALTAWMRLKGVELALTGYAAQQNELLASRQTAETVLLAGRSKARLSLLISIALTIFAVLSLLVGFLWFPTFFVGGGLIVGAIASWIWFSRERKNVQKQSGERDHWVTELQRLDMQRQVAIQTGGDPAALQYYEHQIQEAGLGMPTNLESGQKLQADLKQRHSHLELHAAREAAQIARDNHTRLLEQVVQVRRAAEESRRACDLAQQAGDPTEQLKSLAAQVATQEKVVVLTEQEAHQSLIEDNLWPMSSVEIQAALSACEAELRSIIEAQKQQERASARLLEEAQADQVNRQNLLLQAQKAVSQQRASDPAAQVIRARDVLARTQATCSQQENITQQLLHNVHLLAEAEVEPERGRAEARVRAYVDELLTRSAESEKHEVQNRNFVQKITATAASLGNLLAMAQTLSIAALPAVPQVPSHCDSSFPYEEVWLKTFESIQAAQTQMLLNLNESGAKNRRDTALSEQGRVEAQVSLLKNEQRERQQQIATLFSMRSLPLPPAYTQELVGASWLLIQQVIPEEKEQITQALTEAKQQLYAARQQEETLNAELYHPGTPLNIEECQRKVEELREEREICLRADKLLREAHDRIARRVLPITERNMQPLLQQLTSGRYRDVRLTPEDTNGQPGEMDYRIRVWDPAAGRFVAKNLFSGGTRDQCSLALRLAFALATLPQELGVAPGFIFLDEPLSAFDAQRAQALVGLLTTGTIAQQFNQVVLISHQHAFDREAFQYHIRMEAGQVVESDLPDSVPLLAANPRASQF